MKLTKKAFRDWLNTRDAGQPRWKNRRFHQRVRQYGDYLYAQDKVMFDIEYKEWVKNNGTKVY